MTLLMPERPADKPAVAKRRGRRAGGGPIGRVPARFIGREQDLKQLTRELDTPIELGGAFVLSVAGVGGVGKSTLVRQLMQIRGQALYVVVDERDRVESAAMLAAVVAERLAAALGPDSNCARALLGSAMFGTDAERLLTDAIVHDVNAAEQVVLVLDTYEALRRVAGQWLLETLLGPDGEPIRGDLRILASGREPIQRTDRRWINDWDELIVNIDLEPFSLAETEAFLCSRRGRQPLSIEQVRTAYRTTGGLPVWLGLIGRRAGRADITAGANAEDVQYIVDRLLMWWDDPKLHHWVRTAWIPRSFNLELVRVLLADEAEAAFEWLTHQPAMVHGEGGRWIFHDAVRTALRQEALQRAPRELAEAHDRLADYWSSHVAVGANPFHLVYHRLLGRAPHDAMRLVASLYVRALARGDATLDTIADAALAAREEAASVDGWEPIAAIESHWQARLVGDQGTLATARERLLALNVLDPGDRALLLVDRWQEPALSAAAESSTEPTRTNTRRLRWRRGSPRADAAPRVQHLIEYGDTLRLAGDYDGALAPLNEAVRLDPASAPAWASRGETYRALGQPKAAVQDLSRALRLRADWSWAWAARAAAHLAASAPRKAIADATRAFELDQRNAWALAVRGLAYHLDFGGPVEEAMADLRQAVQMDPTLSWAMTALEQWTTELAAIEPLR